MNPIYLFQIIGIIVLIISFIIIFFVINPLGLILGIKVSKMKKISYSKSLVITVIAGLASLILGIVITLPAKFLQLFIFIFFMLIYYSVLYILIKNQKPKFIQFLTIMAYTVLFKTFLFLFVSLFLTITLYFIQGDTNELRDIGNTKNSKSTEEIQGKN